MLNIIKKKYGSIDNMIDITGTFISRSYLYQICNKQKTRISIEYARELVKLLDLDSIESLFKILE